MSVALESSRQPHTLGFCILIIVYDLILLIHSGRTTYSVVSLQVWGCEFFESHFRHGNMSAFFCVAFTV